MLFDDSILLTDYKTHQEAAGLRASSINQISYKLAGVSRWLMQNRKVPLTSATTRDIEAWMAWKSHEVKGSTARNLWAILKTFFTWRESEGAGVSPMAKIRRPKADTILPHAASQEDVRRLLDGYCNWTWRGCRDRAFAQTLYESGMRVGELAKVTLEDVNLSAREIRIRHPKARLERMQPIGRGATLWLSRWLERREEVATDSQSLFISESGKEMRPQSWSVAISQDGKKCGASHPITAHTLRHSFATHLLEAGADIVSVKELLGHQNIVTTMVYLSVTSQRKRDVRDLIPTF